MRRTMYMLTYVAASAIGAGCHDASAPHEPTADRELGAEAGMPLRVAPADTSRVTAAFSRVGGNVFVQLTAEPTAAALHALSSAGLRPPSGRSAVVVFDNLDIRTVWGAVPAHGVHPLAALPFVTRVEPSADTDGIGPQG